MMKKNQMSIAFVMIMLLSVITIAQANINNNECKDGNLYEDVQEWGFDGRNKLELPIPAPFPEFNGYTGQYSINGSSCVSTNVSTFACDPAFIVIDQPNNRMFLDMGSHGGQYWMFANTSYAIIEATPQMTGKCGILPGFGYQNQVNNYKRAFAYDNGCNRTFIGSVWDIASCNYPVSVRMVLENISKAGKRFTVLGEWDYQQDFPVSFPLGGGATYTECIRVNGKIKLNKSTVNTQKNTFNKYFALPAACNSGSATLVDYCGTNYFSNNPCSAYIH